jgi:hypothetical protein
MIELALVQWHLQSRLDVDAQHVIWKCSSDPVCRFALIRQGNRYTNNGPIEIAVKFVFIA